MDYQIKRDSRRNRVYFRPPAGLYVPRARHDGDLQWFGVADVPRDLKGYLEDLVVKHQAEQQSADSYAAVKETIPADHRKRHGALYGGAVTIASASGGHETFTESQVALGSLRAAKWEQIAQHVVRSGNLGVMDRDVLYRAVLIDGRPVYRETTMRGFGDDCRETYWLPEDLWQAVCLAEITARGITRAKAEEWLAKYRGCVGTELYEFAATLAPAPAMVE